MTEREVYEFYNDKVKVAYRSNTDTPCTKQLMQAFDTYGRSVVAVHEVSLSDVSNYGIFAGA